MWPCFPKDLQASPLHGEHFYVECASKGIHWPLILFRYLHWYVCFLYNYHSCYPAQQCPADDWKRLLCILGSLLLCPSNGRLNPPTQHIRKILHSIESHNNCTWPHPNIYWGNPPLQSWVRARYNKYVKFTYIIIIHNIYYIFTYTSFFQVTFGSPKWRSRFHPWKGHE